VIDLDQVAFVDSAGLGALLSIRERAGELGIDLSIASVSDPVRRILDVTGLRDTLG
jgi:anti-anti-sigma factor